MVTLGADEDGYPETTCVVVELERAPEGRRTRWEPSGFTKIALTALGSLADNGPRLPVPPLPGLVDHPRPSALRAVSEEAWRARAMEAGLRDAGTSSGTARARWSAARTALIDHGYVRIEGDVAILLTR